jgi:ABC-type branched-subunit amino acid transport system permease subunit
VNQIAYLLLGSGNGAVFAAIAVSIVVVYRTSRVLNLATGATALYGAYTYAFITTSGQLFNPLAAALAVSLIMLVGGLAVIGRALLRRRFSLAGALARLAVLALVVGVSRFPPLISIGTNSKVVGLTLAVVTSSLLGAASFLVIFRRLQDAPPLAKIVASIGLMFAIQSLCSVRFGTFNVVGAPLFPQHTITIGHTGVGSEPLLLAATVIVIGVALAAAYRWTRSGLRSLAVAETPTGAMLIGVSPLRVSLYSWLLSGALSGAFGALISSIAPVDPSQYTLFVLPALGAALVARFSSLLAALATGLAIGMAESWLQFAQNYTWWPQIITPSLLPFVVIVIVMIARGQALPGRGALTQARMPDAPAPRHVTQWAVSGTVICAAALLGIGGQYRVAIIMSLIAALLSLSLVVLTGWAGQISFAQMAFAGIAGFMMSPITLHWGVPFPFAPVLAALIAGLGGIVLGLPALRVRGMDLAILTLAIAVAIEDSLFSNATFAGGVGGTQTKPPSLFGINLGLSYAGEYPRAELGFVALALVLIVGIGLVGVRRSRLGMQMLAVRSNERAASAAGIDVGRIKLVAFGISAVIAGLAGAMYAYVYSSGLSTGSFDVFINISLIAVTVLVGITSVTGGVLAGFASGAGVLGVFLLTEAHLGAWYGLVLALGLISATITHPEGIVGLVQEKARSLRERRARHQPEFPPGAPAQRQRADQVVSPR